MQHRNLVRKKRNFKGLGLEHSVLFSTGDLGSSKSRSFVCQCRCLGNIKYDSGLALNLRKEDLDMRGEIGSGSHGYVRKVYHEPTQTLMAMKTFYTHTLFNSPSYTAILPTKSVSSAFSSASSFLDYTYVKTLPTPDTDGGFLSPTRSISSSPPRQSSILLQEKYLLATQKTQHTKPCSLPGHTMDENIDQRIRMREQILKEMKFLHACQSEHIVAYYGAFINGDDVSLCMEYMDVGSLDLIYKKNGPIPKAILQKIALAIVDGLYYLYSVHRIIHRDLKPSNILINSAGQVKICDLGVSGQLTSSNANTFVGTGSYMSPERITGSSYSVKSDIWSLGITLMELAIGAFPLNNNGSSLAFFELLQSIVHEPAPELPKNQFSDDFEFFIAKNCLVKDAKSRATLEELLRTPYLMKAKDAQVDLATWAKSQK